MVRTAKPSRKASFKAALAFAGQTAEAWCSEREITTGHLYQVLSGRRDSAKLVAEIDAYIEKHVPAGSSAA